MRLPHPLPLALAVATLALPAQTASADEAATLATDARCYAQGAPLTMTATGLTPGAQLTVALDGQALRYRDGSTATADANGEFASSFATPALAPAVKQHRHVLTVDDGTHRPHARFTVTRPAGASFAPSEGDPRTLVARFTLWGFALDGGRNQRAWMHWVSPAGDVRRNAALGVARGDCGTLTTPLRRVFPFAPEPGRWLLVIDAHRRYRVHADGARAKIPVHVRAVSP